MTSPGIHHVTAITDNAQHNLDFHVRVLGMRLVKLTVNFDDPGTYHLYYGDDLGAPGTALTYFPWAGVGPGTPGAGETEATSLAVPTSALGYWSDRLAGFQIRSKRFTRFGQEGLALTAPDGMRLELIETDPLPGFTPARGTEVPESAAIRGFHSVALRSRRSERTVGVLTDLLGYRVTATEAGRTRLVSSSGGDASVVDVVAAPAGEPLAEPGSGSVHHVAFRSTAADHLRFRDTVASAGLRITTVQERVYFRSLYFREPGGVLIEIATDDPGFTADETVDRLGSGLRLPPWLEPQRGTIEKSLPTLALPGRTVMA